MITIIPETRKRLTMMTTMTMMTQKRCTVSTFNYCSALQRSIGKETTLSKHSMFRTSHRCRQSLSLLSSLPTTTSAVGTTRYSSSFATSTILRNSNCNDLLLYGRSRRFASESFSTTPTTPFRRSHFFGKMQSMTTTTAIVEQQQRRQQTSSSGQPPPLSSYNEEQKDVMKQCRDIYNDIRMLNTKWHGPLEMESSAAVDSSSYHHTTLPLVLLLGNHSSGKSTFINYILGRQVQTAGVAPTDDSFTIIAPGPVDKDQDGIALAGNPDLGFTPLRQFGPTLLHHTIFKVRNNTRTNFILVDSPGMIDAPGNYNGMLSFDSNQNKNTMAGSTMDRGYDFTGVVRWLANRADIVLLFFDPDKPGTTGETLSVLLHALSGMDHKLLIVLNKADQFEKIHDFARAYGSLCWNLSKVIPRKDLPKIYTMCLPTNNTTNDETTSNNVTPIPAGLQDLHTARDEVVAEVFKAPLRRMDNIITDLQYSTHQLYMYGLIVQDIRQKWSNYVWTLRKQLASVVLSGTTITGGLVTLINYQSSMMMVPASILGLEYMAGTVFAGTIILSGGLHWYQTIQLNEYKKRYIHNMDEINVAFQRTHRKAIRDGDEYEGSIYLQIRNSIEQSLLEYHTVNDVPVISPSELQSLRTISDTDIPNLRRMASPQHDYDNNNDDESSKI